LISIIFTNLVPRRSGEDSFETHSPEFEYYANLFMKNKRNRRIENVEYLNFELIKIRRSEKIAHGYERLEF
jgi:hypothetical protein